VEAILEIINKKIEELIPYENNPRNNEEAVKFVANSIKQFGFKVPIIIDKNNVIVAGHTRLKASEELGLKEVPCIIADDLTDEQIRAFRLADNKVSEKAEWDFNKLDLELGELDLDMTDFGFEDMGLNPDEFGTGFDLPDGEKSDMCTMSFSLQENQKSLIEWALDQVRDEIKETFGNENKNGNALYEVVRQWAEQRK
jgi:hypothetical protein